MRKGDLDERQSVNQQLGSISLINIRNHTFQGQAISHASKREF